MAARGHDVHPEQRYAFRLGGFQAGLTFHRVETPPIRVREPHLLSLANKIVQVARHEQLDIVYAHYAVPHATAAYLARQILAATGHCRVPATITTLHGTDITLLGSDRSYSETVAFCIEQSDGVTAVSESLKADTCRELAVTTKIRVIPNFLNCAALHRIEAAGVRKRLVGDPSARIAIHVSNFRPVKRTPAVVEVFERICRKTNAHLLMVGDGPDLDAASRLTRERGLEAGAFSGRAGSGRAVVVHFRRLPPAVGAESFGLAALEAMACGVPVVASTSGVAGSDRPRPRRVPPPAGRSRRHGPIGGLAGPTRNCTRRSSAAPQGSRTSARKNRPGFTRRTTKKSWRNEGRVGQERMGRKGG